MRSHVSTLIFLRPSAIIIALLVLVVTATRASFAFSFIPAPRAITVSRGQQLSREIAEKTTATSTTTIRGMAACRERGSAPGSSRDWLNGPSDARRDRAFSSSSGLPPPRPRQQCVYISIGPPCSGKSTWLRRQHHHRRAPDESVLDVALDDQPGVYEAVSTLDALKAVASHHSGCSRNRKLDVILSGRSVGDRLRSDDQREFRLVMQRLALQITLPEFAEQMNALEARAASAAASQTDGRVEVDNTGLGTMQGSVQERDKDPGGVSPAHATIEIVEDELSRLIEQHGEGGDVIASPSNAEEPFLPPWMPPTVDLFVQDRIFRTSNDSNLTGIDSAQLNFRNLCFREGGRPIAWGNTNTRPREYKLALQVAEETSRSVHFVTYFDDSASHVFENRDGWRVEFEEDVFALRGDLRELLRRNVGRFLATGRYVPSHVIHAMSERSHNLVKMVADHWRQEQRSDDLRDPTSKGGDLVTSGVMLGPKKVSKFEFDRILARLANYDMNANRTVVQLYPPRRRKNYRDKTNCPGSLFLHQATRQQHIRPWPPVTSIRSRVERSQQSYGVSRPLDKRPRQVVSRHDHPMLLTGNRSRPDYSQRDLYRSSRPQGVPPAPASVNATIPRFVRRDEGS